MTRTGSHDDPHATGNRDYQAGLAQTPIANFGVESATHACQTNSWDGVLAHVLAHRSVEPPAE